MKKIYLLIFAFIFTFFSNAQDAELTTPTWYLHDLVIGGTSHLPPRNSEIYSIPLTFNLDVDTPNYFIESQTCNVIFSTTTVTINAGTTSLESIHGFGHTLAFCTYDVNGPYENVYFSFYMDALPFNASYAITDNPDGSKTLVFTKPNGDQAIYGDVELPADYVSPLSVPKNSNSTFAIYPNPVDNTLFLKTSDNQTYTSAIFDVFGKRIMDNKTLQQTENTIDVSALKSGVYFISLTNEFGEKQQHKFIKN